MDPLTKPTPVSTSKFGEQCFSETNSAYSTGPPKSQVDQSRMNGNIFGKRVYGSDSHTSHDTSAKTSGEDKTSHFDHFNAVPSYSSDLWNVSAPWYQFQAPEGVDIHPAIESISLQNTSGWAVGSYPSGGLTSGMDDGLHSSIFSLPTELPATSDPYNTSEENSNHMLGSWYKSILTSPPQTGHDPVGVDDVFWDVTWGNIFIDASFDHQNVFSSVPRAWTPTSDIISTNSSSDAPSSESWARDLNGKYENPEAISTAMAPATQLHLLSPADINGRSPSGQTILHFAAQKGHLKVAELILEAGADHGIQDNEGQSPLHVAATEGHCAVVRLLLSAGVNINAIDIHGQNALHIACRKKHLDVVKVLLGSGIELNARSASGLTPLHYAAESGCDAVVRLLLERGADANAKSDND